MLHGKIVLFRLVGMLSLILPALARAQDDALKTDTGDTAWLLVASALVFLMTPGLAFFYGGMVRTKNVTTTLFQSFSAVAIVAAIWALVGYSLAFAPGSSIVGGFQYVGLNGVGQEPNGDLAGSIPHVLFMVFQCMFAVITPALMTGAFSERVKFKGWIILCAIWSLVIYSPVTHWVWGLGGWIREMGALDFAGGLVVHMTAGFSALALAIVLGKRKDFGTDNKPYDLGYIGLGTALLFFGWFGFNGGSSLAADGLAAHAFTTTFFSGAAALAAWVVVDSFFKGKPSFVGACIGAVVGLVSITPAAAFVAIPSAIFIGAFSSVAANFVATFVKGKLKIDDSLDVFACHGVGGLLGIIFTGIFATKAVNAGGADGLIASGNPSLLFTQLTCAAAVAAVSFVGTLAIAKLIDATLGLRSLPEDEDKGLDLIEHGEAVNSNFSA